MALIALKNRWVLAIPLVWVFSLVGTADLANALRQDDAIMHMGATWFIPTFLVPLLLATHVMIFSRLIKHARNAYQNDAPVKIIAAIQTHFPVDEAK